MLEQAGAEPGRSLLCAPDRVAEERDRKGLYAKVRRGHLKGLTGIDDPYEAPEHPQIVIDGARGTPEEAAALIIRHLESRGYLEPSENRARYRNRKPVTPRRAARLWST